MLRVYIDAIKRWGFICIFNKILRVYLTIKLFFKKKKRTCKKNCLKANVFWRERKVREGVILFIRIKKNPIYLIRVDAEECYPDKKKSIEVRLQVSKSWGVSRNLRKVIFFKWIIFS